MVETIENQVEVDNFVTSHLHLIERLWDIIKRRIRARQNHSAMQMNGFKHF